MNAEKFAYFLEVGEIIMFYSKRKKIGLAVLFLGTLVIGTAFAFGKGHGGFHRGFGPQGFPPPFLLERISKELGLSDEQQTQAKAILESSKERIKPLMEQMKQNHAMAKNLGTDGNFDEAKVNEIANEQSETMKQLFIEKEKTKAQLFAILTPEQREKAKQMQDKFAERMKGRFGKFGETPAPSE